MCGCFVFSACNKVSLEFCTQWDVCAHACVLSAPKSESSMFPYTNIDRNPSVYLEFSWESCNNMQQPLHYFSHSYFNCWHQEILIVLINTTWSDDMFLFYFKWLTQCISLHKVLMRHFCAVLNISNRKYVFARRLKGRAAIFSSNIFHPDTLCFIAVLSNSQMTPRKAMRLLSMVIMKHLSNIWKIRICSFNEALTLTLMVPSSSISFLMLTLEQKNYTIVL